MHRSGIPREAAPSRDHVCVQIVEEVAHQKGTDVLQLPPISTVVDPDRLGDLVHSAEDTTLVSFEYAGFRVHVWGTEYVELTKVDA